MIYPEGIKPALGEAPLTWSSSDGLLNLGGVKPATPEEMRGLLRRDVVLAAPALLGWVIAWGELRAAVVETEAYRGDDDPACHAFRRPQMRNMVLYGEPGHAYIYLNYGMHWMLNVSAHEEGRAAGILIRAAEPLAGLHSMRANRQGAGRRLIVDRDLLSGPGKLAKAFGITGDQNGVDLLSDGDGLRLVPGSPPSKVVTGPRVGIAEGKWHDVPWRFADADRAQWVSKPRP